MENIAWQLFYKSAPNSAQASPLMGQGVGLPFPAASLFQPQGGLTSLSSSSCSRSKLGKSLKQAHSLASDHHHTEGPPHLSHHLAQHCLCRTFPTGSPAHVGTPGFSKQAEKLVEVGGL